MKNEGSLQEKTIVGFIWSAINTLMKQGIQFIIQIILARLLVPEYFGLIGMITIFISISNCLVESGFTQALIRDSNANQQSYSTVFYFNLGMSFLIYILLFIMAEPISSFYGEPLLLNVIRTISLVIIINAFGIIQKVIMVKRVDFKTETKINTFSVLVSGAVAVTLALLNYGIWSLVFQTLIMQLVQTILCWIIIQWKPIVTFNRKLFKKYYKYGYKLLMTSLIDIIYYNSFYVIIGKIFTPTQLGYYTNSSKIVDTLSQTLGSTIQRVTFPIMSTIQHEEERLKNGVRKIIRVAAYLSFPVMSGLIVIATPFINILFGEMWKDSVIYFRLLCIAGMFTPIIMITLNVLEVKGRSDLVLKLEIIKKSFLTVLILIVVIGQLGILSLINVLVVNSFLTLIINNFYCAKEILYTLKEQLQDILPALLLSILMGISVYFISFINQWNDYSLIIIQIVVGVLVYGIGSKLLGLKEYKIAINLVFKVIGKGER